MRAPSDPTITTIRMSRIPLSSEQAQTNKGREDFWQSTNLASKGPWDWTVEANFAGSAEPSLKTYLSADIAFLPSDESISIVTDPAGLAGVVTINRLSDFRATDFAGTSPKKIWRPSVKPVPTILTSSPPFVGPCPGFSDVIVKGRILGQIATKEYNKAEKITARYAVIKIMPRALTYDLPAEDTS
jgi:hypothetical protein